MIVSKSRLQATLPEEQSGRLSPCRIGDSVPLSFTILAGKSLQWQILRLFVRFGETELPISAITLPISPVMASLRMADSPGVGSAIDYEVI
jgi:hypothetical protein